MEGGAVGGREGGRKEQERENGMDLTLNDSLGAKFKRLVHCLFSVHTFCVVSAAFECVDFVSAKKRNNQILCSCGSLAISPLILVNITRSVSVIFNSTFKKRFGFDFDWIFFLSLVTFTARVHTTRNYIH